MSVEMRSFLQLVYSLAKQYISWYEREIKQEKYNTVTEVNNGNL